MKLGQGELRLDQWHHGYLGLLLVALGLWRSHHSSATLWSVILTLGWIVLTDDLLQHLIQWLWVDLYHSPLHVIYEHTIWKWLH